MAECKRCNRTDLEIKDMVKDVGRPSKIRALCLKCKQADAADLKMKIPKVNKDVFLPMTTMISPRQRRNLGAAVYTGPRVRDENEALPWSINKMAGTYVPEPGHHRNDGLKHIKSLAT